MFRVRKNFVGLGGPGRILWDQILIFINLNVEYNFFFQNLEGSMGPLGPILAPLACDCTTDSQLAEISWNLNIRTGCNSVLISKIHRLAK